MMDIQQYTKDKLPELKMIYHTCFENETTLLQT